MKFAFASIAAALLLTACGGGDSEPEKPKFAVIRYEVTGLLTTRASVTYENTGKTEQKTVNLPASLPDFGVAIGEPGDFLYVSAQNQSSSGSVTVNILVNGTVVKSATSSGAFGIATARATCC
jgi:hypothetical protein